MWRFIAISFAFLGWSFYQLSGGADYQPRSQSIQARAQLDNVRPSARPVRVNVIQLADADEKPVAVTGSITSLADLNLTEGDRFEITLASASDTLEALQPDIADLPEVTVETTKARVQPEESDLPRMSDAIAAAVEQASLANLAAGASGDVTDGSTAQRDLRQITGDLVNMRGGPGTRYDRIGKLRKGAEVVVLRDNGDGWVKLRVVETGRVGWIADWLVTAAN